MHLCGFTSKCVLCLTRDIGYRMFDAMLSQVNCNDRTKFAWDFRRQLLKVTVHDDLNFQISQRFGQKVKQITCKKSKVT